MFETFRDVIAIWPTPDAMAEDIGHTAFAVRQWKTRDRIPAEWWLRVIAAAKKRRRSIRFEDLDRIRGQRDAA
jgi:hypothetical protein